MWVALLSQVVGRRRVVMVSPDQAFSGLYPYPVHHPYDHYSMVDFESPDFGLWPKFGQVNALCAILQPGDVLFVPQYWCAEVAWPACLPRARGGITPTRLAWACCRFAYVQELEPEGLTLSFHLLPGMRAPAPDTVALRLSRVLEERVADAESMQVPAFFPSRHSKGCICPELEAPALLLSLFSGT